ncbi:MAG: peptidase M61, partial [Xanthomonadales bacterium]|nr:peptidase M61 [Xanthomonadales bacterium]
VDDPDAGGFLYFRRWKPVRDTTGEVQLSYRAPIGNYVPALGAGPPFDLRAQGGGLSGAFNTFLVVPDSDRPFMIGIDWRLGQLAEGSLAVTSFGEGPTRSPGPSDRLIATYVMAGPLGRFRSEGEGPEFTGYWIGNPGFDADALLAWSARAYGAIADFFQQDEPPPYRVLMRGNPYPGGGGAALMGSYLLSFPDTLEDAEQLRETIAHETVHNWISSIGGPPGSTSWFSEGMTVAYTRRLLLRSGLFTPAEFLDSVNDTALGYYTNALNTLPNDEIAAGFWRDTRVRSLPYARGSLYFAAVDAAVREQSGGTRSLDHLLNAFLARTTAGEEVTGETWREIVIAELGPPGGAALDAMLGGALVVPPSDAFGPCFERRASVLRRFELGFDREALVTEPRIVGGLVEGSAAAQAGLENGDEILQPVALEEAQSTPDLELELKVRRGERELTIGYLPRGESVDGWLWERVAAVADAECAL